MSQKSREATCAANCALRVWTDIVINFGYDPDPVSIAKLLFPAC